MSDHNLTLSKLLSASNMASFTRFAEYSSALFMSHILSYAKRKSSFLQCLVFPQFFQHSALAFLIPFCNFLQQAPPCFAVSKIFLSPQTFGVCAHKVRLTSSPGRVATFGVGKKSSAHQINHKISTGLMSTILSTSTSKK